tara:strand:+ start:3531 stop:5507 length:1977 start_codon:yes stop_codon:yes gene_type:complete
MLFYYNFETYKLSFNSDAAVKNLMAREVFESGRIILSDWYYANGDIWVLFGPIVTAPLLLFFDNSFFLHGMSATIYSLLLMFSIWKLISIFEIEYRYKISILALISSGISDQLANALYGEHAYGLQLIIYIWIFILVNNIYFQTTKTGRSNFKQALLSLVVILSTCTNPSRFFIVQFIPILLSLFITHSIFHSRYFDGNKIKSLHHSLLFSNLFASFLIGALIYVFLLGHVEMITGVKPIWQSFTDFINNILGFLEAWFSIGFGWFDTGTAVSSLNGFYKCIMFFFSLFILTFPPFLLFNKFKNEMHLKYILLLVYINTSFFILLALMLLTTLHQNSYLGTARYYAPVFVLFVVASLIFAFKSLKGKAIRVFFSVGLLLISSVTAFKVLVAPQDEPMGLERYNKTINIIKLLKDNGLSYGYATYWNAGKITVLSDFDIKVRQVHLSSTYIEPMRWLSSQSWYEASKKTKRNFILLNENEAKLFDLTLFKNRFNLNYEELFIDGYHVYIFNQDLASILPTWKLHLTIPYLLPINEKSQHQIGIFNKESSHTSIVSQKGEVGFLHFGPFKNMEKGQYIARFKVKSASADNVGFVDITSTREEELDILNRVELNQLTKTPFVEVKFSIKSIKENVEFRVFSNGKERLEFLSLSVFVDYPEE